METPLERFCVAQYKSIFDNIEILFRYSITNLFFKKSPAFAAGNFINNFLYHLGFPQSIYKNKKHGVECLGCIDSIFIGLDGNKGISIRYK